VIAGFGGHRATDARDLHPGGVDFSCTLTGASRAMSQFQTRILKTSLSALHYSGAARLLAPAARGLGAILMLHHVSPEEQAGFSPNRILTITPSFLDDVIRSVRREGFDTVSIEEAKARIEGSIPSPHPFVCFTFDDGYRDNRDHALPVMKRHGVPMTIYATSDFARHTGFLWWLVLERVIARRQILAVALSKGTQTFRCGSPGEKAATFDHIYWWLRTRPETDARAVVADLANESGIDVTGPCRELAMTWDELSQVAADPLVTVGAHTVSHVALAKLSAPEAFAQMQRSIADVEHHLGRPCRHFCYPYGDPGSAGEREFEMAARLGLGTAVTTRKGTIQAGHAGRMTALPRLSLNGDYQQLRYVKALLSGVPFLLWNLLERSGRSPANIPGFIQPADRA
jgi:peptidoglycan/xylan/chitin deacetylase (PgdA/CDA1 family)